MGLTTIRLEERFRLPQQRLLSSSVCLLVSILICFNMAADPLATLPSGVKLLLCNPHNLIPEKLTNHNYPVWSIRVKKTLSANLLLGWVDGTGVVSPINVTVTDKDVKASMEPNPAHMSWALVDVQVHACLLAAISPKIQKYGHVFTTSGLF